MTEPIRWGVLGAGKFARDFMGPAINAARGADLAALATRSPEKAEPFRAIAPHLRVHDTYDSLLADPQIDAVYIPLPNTLHVEWTRKAAEAGKHVLCEKPLAMHADAFDEVIALRDETGLLIAEAFMIVHHPQWQRTRALVAEGAIGTLRHVNAIFSYDNSADPGNIRNTKAMGGGGLPDIGVYTIGGPRFVTGAEPEEVAARIAWENGVDTKAEVTARFPGFSFFSVVSMRMAPWQEVLFHGTGGILRLTAPFNANVFGEARVEHRDLSGRVTVEAFPAAAHYIDQVEAFGDTLRGGTPYPVPLEFSRGTQAMIDRVFAAAGPPPR